MKNWQETQHVFETLGRLSAEGKRAALAVVYRIEGSAYRRAGAKLLVDEDGNLTGNISGGCLEQDVRERALRVIASGVAELVRYRTGDEDDLVWGMGLGCNGRVDVLLTPCPQKLAAEVCEEVRACFGAARRFSLTYLLGEDPETGSLRVAGEDDPACTEEAFTEMLVPPPSLVVCGAGDDALPLVRLAAEVGFRVTVADHRVALLTEARFPGAERVLCERGRDAGERLPPNAQTYAVIMTHILERDQAWTQHFLNAKARYIGLLGSRSRREHLLGALGAEGDVRVFGPVGLDLGAEGPEQIAVSVVAEILAVEAGRTGNHLRKLDTAIHP